MSEEAPIHVLLVEDNPGDILLAKEMLGRSRLHMSLHVVRDGVKAMRFLRREGDFSDAPTPDLILLDLNLPGKRGQEVLSDIKRDDALSIIPVVVLTSSTAKLDVMGSYRGGANCFITKPMELEEFERTVASIGSFWFETARLPSR